MNKLLTIIIIILFSFSAMAQKLEKLEKGQTAPFTGVLVDAKQMKKFRQVNEEKKLLDKKNIKLKDLNVLKDQKIELYKKEITQTHKELTRYKTKTFFTNAGYFALGVILTGFAAKTAIESTR